MRLNLFILLALLLLCTARDATTIERSWWHRASIWDYFRPPPLRIMTFNIWECGAEVIDGVQKIVRHIQTVNPDIVCLQEVNFQQPHCFQNLTTLLGPEWQGIMRDGGYPDDAIFTRHHFHYDTYSQTESAVGIKLLYRQAHSNRELNITVWSTHLNWRNYGGDAADQKLCGDETQMWAGELNVGTDSHGRAINVGYLLQNEQFAGALENADKEPLILAGDFNSPSHLDWTEEARPLHGGWAFAWPATRMLEKAGMIDSYRQLHPDPTKHIGVTWSTVNKYHQDYGYTIFRQQDRIDLILYKSSLLTPTASGEYFGDAPLQYIPYHQHNDYPSDHAAFITDFNVNFHK